MSPGPRRSLFGAFVFGFLLSGQATVAQTALLSLGDPAISMEMHRRSVDVEVERSLGETGTDTQLERAVKELLPAQ
jgi:hypothetical protein